MSTKTVENFQRSQILVALAKRFVQRAKALGYKGKARDNMALEYFVGAASALEAAGEMELARKVTEWGVMVISIRGYMGVTELLTPQQLEEALYG